MSRTKGVNSAERHERDEYITPPWCAKRFVEKYGIRIPQGTLCYDPCAAKGELIQTVRSVRPDLRWFGTEINPNHAEALAAVVGTAKENVCKDFLSCQSSASNPQVLILSNPPYCLAQEFIEHGLRWATRVAYLLRINFLADGRGVRCGFAEKHNPGVFVLPNRPSFDGHGSDGTEYAWFVFGDPEVAGRWFSLAQTPEEEIRAWNAAMRKIWPKPEKKRKEKASKKPFSTFP
jgi:hypothetical protein